MAEISLQRSYSRFKTWSDEHKVSEGAIDGVLIESLNLEGHVLKLLKSIGQTLTNSKWILALQNSPLLPLGNDGEGA